MKGQVKKNKRNITGGDIHMNQIDQNDRVDEEVTQDYEGSLIKVLDLQPEITQIFLENLQNGDFIPIDEESLKRKIKIMKESQKTQIQSENALLDLNTLIHQVFKVVDRFVFFFQGLLAGMTLMHLVIVYLKDEQTFINDYSRYSLRIDQVFYIILLISCFGSVFTTYMLHLQKQKRSLASDSKYFMLSLVSSVFYGLSYILWVIGHRTMALLSINQMTATDGQFQFWKGSQIGITLLTVLGWIFSVNTTESNLDYLAYVKGEEEFKIN